ncbi:MAG: LysR family transcriptional regulator [Marinobacter sp.]|uniref:LysR family transcriptional regulator n=1 Tax=Marinobacter sp. TaxID=50741 RepID=UPI00299D3AB7|nr:LysR family transcriptional regulator [Marinobacter sp.]MDX1756159.1 LysR family transcriptional regulator [Marinobacter sp.]
MKWSLEQLRTFICVADAGGFSKAGERLFLAQSTISWQIKQLENQIGTPLLRREPRGVSLTDKGMAFYQRARAVIEANEAAESWLASGAGEPTVIRVATTECYADCWLPDLMRKWKQRCPAVQVVVECGFSTDIWERFRLGEIDIALAQHCPQDIEGERVRLEPLDWVCSRNTALWEREVLPLALFEQGCPDREIMQRALTSAGRCFQLEFETHSFSGMLAAVQSGLAVAALPRSTIPESLERLGSGCGLPQLPALNVMAAVRSGPNGVLATQFRDEIKAYLRGTLQRWPEPRELAG